MNKVKVEQMNPELPLPSYQSEDASGMDLLYNGDTFILNLGDITLAGTGLKVEIPKGYEMQIRPRSGWAMKHGITVLNSPGTIDSDYRGEVKVILINHGKLPVEIVSGERIAQCVFSSFEKAVWEVVDKVGITDRGEGGFGHTGK